VKIREQKHRTIWLHSLFKELQLESKKSHIRTVGKREGFKSDEKEGQDLKGAY